VPAGHHRKTPPWTLRLRRLRTPAGFVLALATAIPISASAQMTTADGPVTATAASPAPEAVRSEMHAASRSRHRLSAPVPRPVRVTGTVRGPQAEIAWKDRKVWMRKAYLARNQPSATAHKSPSPTAPAAGASGAPCPDGSGVEAGLQANTVTLYRAVCAAFPVVSAWGGRSGSGGDHGAGRALDIMSTGSLRDAIADYVRSHAAEFGVSEVIRAQHIWTVQRSSEGWRLMEDRGSATANHYDHVHVSLY
jgi:hypothetical protein